MASAHEEGTTNRCFTKLARLFRSGPSTGRWLMRFPPVIGRSKRWSCTPTESWLRLPVNLLEWNWRRRPRSPIAAAVQRDTNLPPGFPPDCRAVAKVCMPVSLRFRCSRIPARRRHRVDSQLRACRTLRIAWAWGNRCHSIRIDPK
jgi:hypothetical protein